MLYFLLVSWFIDSENEIECTYMYVYKHIYIYIFFLTNLWICIKCQDILEIKEPAENVVVVAYVSILRFVSSKSSRMRFWLWTEQLSNCRRPSINWCERLMSDCLSLSSCLWYVKWAYSIELHMVLDKPTTLTHTNTHTHTSPHATCHLPLSCGFNWSSLAIGTAVGCSCHTLPLRREFRLKQPKTAEVYTFSCLELSTLSIWRAF